MRLRRITVIIGLMTLAGLLCPTVGGSDPTSHVRPVKVLEFSPDGSLLASAGLDGFIRVWEADSGALRYSLRAQDQWIVALVRVPGTEWLLTLNNDGLLRLWNDLDGSLIHTVREARGTRALAVSPDGRLLATANPGRGIGLRRLPDLTVVSTLDLTNETVNSLVFSSGAEHVFCALSDGTIRAWDVRRNLACEESIEVGSEATVLTLSPDGNWLAAGTKNGDLHAWQLVGEDQSGRDQVRWLDRPIGDYRCFPDEFIRENKEWAVRQGIHGSRVTGLDFSRDGTMLASSGLDHIAQILDFETGAILSRVELSSDVDLIRFSPTGREVAFGTSDGVIHSHMGAGRFWKSPMAASGPVSGIQFSDDGRLLLSTAYGALNYRSIRKFRADMGGRAGTFVAGTFLWVNGLTFSADSRQLSASTEADLVVIWDLTDGTLLQAFKRSSENNPGKGQAGSDVGNGRKGQAGSGPGNSKKGQAGSRNNPGKGQAGSQAAFEARYAGRLTAVSPDGKRLAVVADDGLTIRILEPGSEAPGLELIDVSRPVFNVQSSPVTARHLFRVPISEIRLVAAAECGSDRDGRCVTVEGNLRLAVTSDGIEDLFLIQRNEPALLESSRDGLTPLTRPFTDEATLGIGLAGGVDLAAGDEIRITGLELIAPFEAYGGGSQTEFRFLSESSRWEKRSFFLPLRLFPEVVNPIRLEGCDPWDAFAELQFLEGRIVLPAGVDASPLRSSGDGDVQSRGSAEQRVSNSESREVKAENLVSASAGLTFRAAVDFVRIDCTVRDRSGNHIRDLTQEDFRITEDGKVKRIGYFSQALADEALPAHVVLLVDSSTSVLDKLETEQRAAQQFIREVLREELDHAAIIQFDSDVTLLQDFTDSKALLEEALIGIRPGGATDLNDGIWLATKELLRGRDGRRILVVLSDGKDTSSTIKESEVRRMVLNSGVSVFAIGVQSVGYEVDFEVLEQLAEVSGGIFLDSSDDPKELESAFRTITRLIQAQYTIGYSIDRERSKGGFREIEIKVKRRGAKVQHREGFYIE